jgi:WD40 repeat protein
MIALLWCGQLRRANWHSTQLSAMAKLTVLATRPAEIESPNSVQIWNAETGDGIVSIRNSSVLSLAWTADGTHVIGGRKGKVTIWNSVDGGQLRTWKAHNGWIELSLSPTSTHLATSDSSWNGKSAFVFDTSTGKQITTLKHDGNVNGIAFSPSGWLIATGCDDNKIYLWEAPASEGPQTKVSLVPRIDFFFNELMLLVGSPCIRRSPNQGQSCSTHRLLLQRIPFAQSPTRPFSSLLDVCTHPCYSRSTDDRSIATRNSASRAITQRRKGGRPVLGHSASCAYTFPFVHFNHEN